MNPCESIVATLGGLFQCEQINEYIRIRTPFLYPDGDVIDIFAKEIRGVTTLTDLGESLRWLRNQSPSPKRTSKQFKFIEDICLTHGLENYRGMLTTKVSSNENYADAVIRVAQGSLRVADLWFTMRTRSVETLSDEVETLLTESHFTFARNDPKIGRSGLIYRPDFHVYSPTSRGSLIYILSTGSKAAAKSVTDRVVTSWYDLSSLKVGQSALQFVSLFDDTMNVWSDEEIRLLGELSTVARWSNPDEFVEILKN
jgi:hypothetical protein